MTRPSKPEAGAPIFRIARPEDDAEIVALWRAAGLLVPWNDPEADIARCRAQPQCALLIAERWGRIVASAMAGDDGHRGWLYYVAVEETSRGKGLGRAIVGRAEEWLRARGVAKVEVLVRGGNAQVRSFYERLGYTAKDRIILDRWLATPPVPDRG
jgi:ribosomal protein S18 acetylase RimI-like enzyme